VLTIGTWPTTEGAGAEVLAVSEELREAWDERAAIMDWDGGRARPVAERAAVRCLTDGG
jgi:hypothetical protein